MPEDVKCLRPFFTTDGESLLFSSPLTIIFPKTFIEFLREILKILDDYDMSKYVSIDLGIVQSLNYYTGTIFKGFTHGVGFPILGGGRYDNLIELLGGKSTPAVGFAGGIDRIIEKLKEKENLEKELDKTFFLISSKKENLSIITSEMNLLQKQILSFSTAFNEKDYLQSMENLKLLDKRIKELNQKSSDILAKEKSLEELRKDLSERRDRFFDISICPTCLQNVPNSHKHNILNETEGKISDIRKQLIEISAELNIIQNNLELGNNEREKLEKEKTRLEILRSKKEDTIQAQKRLDDYKKQASSLEKDILLLEKHLESLRTDIASYSKFAQSAKQKQDELKKAFLDEKNAEIFFAEKRKELQLTAKEEENLNLIIANKELVKSNLQNSLELNDWLSSQFSTFIDNIERSVLLKLRKEFSNIFNKWFHMLAGQSFEVQLDENFTPLIMSQDTEMDYQFLSGGERTAVALAYRLALNQTINSLMSQIRTKDIVILDEPTEGFSEAQIIKIREVLEELNAAQLIIVSHEQKIEGFVDNVIRLEKQGSSAIKSTTLKHKA